MQKKIKDFIEMMESQYNLDKKVLEEYLKNEYASGLCRRSDSIINSSQFIALKASLDKPVSKMEITTDMVHYFREKTNYIGDYDIVKEALEAVFDHIYDVVEKPIIPEQKDEKKYIAELSEDNTGWPLFEGKKYPYRCTICKKGKITLTSECECGGSKKEPKKQTLMETILAKHPEFLTLGKKEWVEFAKLISEYLEQR